MLSCTATSPKTKELQPHMQSHLLSVVKKVKAFLEYQGVLPYKDALSFLEHVTHSVLHDWNKWCAKSYTLPIPSSFISFIHPVHSSPTHPILLHLIQGITIRCKNTHKIIVIHSPYKKRTVSYLGLWNSTTCQYFCLKTLIAKSDKSTCMQYCTYNVLEKQP